MLFDFIFAIINQIFYRAAVLFDGAFRRLDPVFDSIGHSFFHALNSRFKLRAARRSVT
jgi:hypothetical protein